MTVVITGGGGFLGWHTRVLLRSRGEVVRPIFLGDAFDSNAAADLVSGADRVIHLAGVNRGDDQVVAEGNIGMASRLADAIRHAEVPPRIVAYANSTQVGNGSVYGTAKQKAADILAAACDDAGARFENELLPNLFGEHGRPFYNSVTATFCDILAGGGSPTVQNDKELTLLHAQTAAEVLAGVITADAALEARTTCTVGGLLRILSHIAVRYSAGDVPDLASPFHRDLFNTYRSISFSRRPSLALTTNSDARGGFTEVIRAHGGAGQTSFSTTQPQVTRGQHYHRRKVERFAVVSGNGVIRLRRALTDEVLEIPVTGDEPTAVDMPTMWAHSITNSGSAPLLTLFWSNEIFDPSAPDTFAENV